MGVGIIRVYAPIAVDAYVLDADDLAVFRAQTSAAAATEDTNLLSQYMYRAGHCRAHRCGRALRCAPRAPRALVHWNAKYD